MDIRNYIESGTLEEYLLGVLTPEEAAEVEQNARLYPAVRQELAAIEKALEQYAVAHAQTPPPGILENILQQIDTLPTPSLPSGGSAAPSFWSRLKPKNLARFLAIGMTIKFALAVTGLCIIYFQNQQLHNRLEARQTELNKAQASCDSIATNLEKSLRFLRDVDTQPVVMTGQGIAPQAVAAVHFNNKERKAYLTKVDLPNPPVGKKYQLWAIVDAKPVSMGVFNLPAKLSALLEVPFVENASAFAISLEEEGGKPQPTMDQIYVLGIVKS